MAEKLIRTPFPIVSVEKSGFKETYGGAEDIVTVFCTLIRTLAPSDTCLVTMHPIGGTGWLPIMGTFARAGLHVLACDSRYRGADYALNMEKVTVDLASCMRHAREVLGYKHVVLLGWSGGGSHRDRRGLGHGLGAYGLPGAGESAHRRGPRRTTPPARWRRTTRPLGVPTGRRRSGPPHRAGPR